MVWCVVMVCCVTMGCCVVTRALFIDPSDMCCWTSMECSIGILCSTGTRRIRVMLSGTRRPHQGGRTGSHKESRNVDLGYEFDKGSTTVRDPELEAARRRPAVFVSVPFFTRESISY